MSYGRKDSIYRDLLNTPINWKEWAIVPVLKVSPKVNSKNKHGFTIDTTSQAIFYNSIQKVAYVYDVYSPDRIDPVRVNPELAMLFKKEASSRFIAYLLGMEMPMYSVYGYCSAGQTYYFTDAANSSKTLSVFIEKQFGSVAKYCERFQDQITEKEIRDSIKRSRGSKEYGLLLQDWNLYSKYNLLDTQGTVKLFVDAMKNVTGLSDSQASEIKRKTTELLILMRGIDSISIPTCDSYYSLYGFDLRSTTSSFLTIEQMHRYELFSPIFRQMVNQTLDRIYLIYMNDKTISPADRKKRYESKVKSIFKNLQPM